MVELYNFRLKNVIFYVRLGQEKSMKKLKPSITVLINLDKKFGIMNQIKKMLVSRITILLLTILRTQMKNGMGQM